MPGLVCRASRLGTHGRAKRDGMAGTGPAMTTQVVQGKQKNALARSGQITRKISSRTRVTAAEISSEPIHPTRLEKKKNTISLALGAALQRRRRHRRDALSPAMIDANAWPVGAFRQGAKRDRQASNSALGLCWQRDLRRLRPCRDLLQHQPFGLDADQQQRERRDQE